MLTLYSEAISLWNYVRELAIAEFKVGTPLKFECQIYVPCPSFDNVVVMR